MLAPLEAERRAAGSRPLVLCGGACAALGLVGLASYDHALASNPAPALALYVPSTGLQPVAVPGPQTMPASPPSAMTSVAPVASPSFMMPMQSPGTQMPGAIEAPVAMMPASADSSETQTGPQMLFTGIFAGLASSFAIGFTMTAKRMYDGMKSKENSLEGSAGRRAGVPAMMAADEGRYMYGEPFAPAGMGREYINAEGVRKPLKNYVGANAELNIAAYFRGERDFEPWDPLDLCKLSKVSANNPDVAWLREAELKHGRIAMLAFVGILATAGNKHFSPESFESAAAAGWPNALGEIQKTNPGIFAQGLATIGLIEGVTNTRRGAWWDGLWFGERAGSKVVAGDLYWDPLKLMPKDPKAADLMREKELRNGRLAMLAVMGIFTGYLNTGKMELF